MTLARDEKLGLGFAAVVAAALAPVAYRLTWSADIRAASGLAVKRLTAHGFQRIECDDGRTNLAPPTVKR